MTRLFELKNIAGVKDATANLARVSQQRHAMGPDFIQLSGEDMTALAYMAAGGHGCISVVANVAPKLCAELMSAVPEGRLRRRHSKSRTGWCRCMTPLGTGSRRSQAWASSCWGVHEEVRLPLMTVTPPTGKVIRDAMVHAGLIN